MRAWIEKDAILCRACGARYAAPSNNREIDAVCQECWAAFVHARSKSKIYKGDTGTDFNKWLSRRVSADIGQMYSRGMVGRCEAISKSTHNAGYQCASRAIAKRDGRKVCHTHQQAEAASFIDEEIGFTQTTLIRNIAAMASKDASFRIELIEALKP